jgi:hypothetical protein
MAKVKLGDLIQNMVEEVDEVEKSDRDQGDKTRRYKAIAGKFKTALFTDKRKYRGEGIKKRITANTFNAYITRARKRFDDRFHHHFEKNVTRLVARYPMYASELNEWLSLTPADVRQRLTTLQHRLNAIGPLAEDLSDIRLGSAAAKKKLQRLVKKYPEWQLSLDALSGSDWEHVRDETYQAFQQGEQLLGELNQLKVNHEILYHLQLSSAERSSIQQRWSSILGEKKRSTVALDYPRYMQSIHNILNTPARLFNLSTRSGMAPLAFALAAVSGRRMIEIMWLGEFKIAGRYAVEFTGQAKKRSEDGAVSRTIYTLCDSALFLEKLSELRSCPAACDFHEVVEGFGALDTRSENGRLNGILANAFNPWVKGFFGNDERVFKDSRAIYARIAYEMWFRHDPKWQNVDEDVFFSDILGHDDENTQLHYKQFKLVNFSRTWRPDKGQENERLARLEKLDPEMEGFARGGAGVRLHNTVKQIIEEQPDAKVTNTMLRRYGFNTPMISRYLAFAADALGQTIGESGHYQLVEDRPQIIVVDTEDSENDTNDEPATVDGTDEDEGTLEDDELDVDDDKPDPVKKNDRVERPVFKAPKKVESGIWVVEFSYQNRRYFWNGHADNAPAAMKQAWETYF